MPILLSRILDELTTDCQPALLEQLGTAIRCEETRLFDFGLTFQYEEFEVPREECVNLAPCWWDWFEKPRRVDVVGRHG